MEVLYQALEWIMNGCYAICHNYGIAIILFTLISKIILLPVSIWVQKNSIKMVKCSLKSIFDGKAFWG